MLLFTVLLVQIASRMSYFARHDSADNSAEQNTIILPPFLQFLSYERMSETVIYGYAFSGIKCQHLV